MMSSVHLKISAGLVNCRCKNLKLFLCLIKTVHELETLTAQLFSYKDSTCADSCVLW
jgi:hypothetical protein